jgi:hypothetical protein
VVHAYNLGYLYLGSRDWEGLGLFEASPGKKKVSKNPSQYASSAYLIPAIPPRKPKTGESWSEADPKCPYLKDN